PVARSLLYLWRSRPPRSTLFPYTTLFRSQRRYRPTGVADWPAPNARGNPAAVWRRVQCGKLEQRACGDPGAQRPCAAGYAEQARQGRGFALPGPLDRREALPLANAKPDGGGRQAWPGNHQPRGVGHRAASLCAREQAGEWQGRALSLLRAG